MWGMTRKTELDWSRRLRASLAAVFLGAGFGLVFYGLWYSVNMDATLAACFAALACFALGVAIAASLTRRPDEIEIRGVGRPLVASRSARMDAELQPAGVETRRVHLPLNR